MISLKKENGKVIEIRNELPCRLFVIARGREARRLVGKSGKGVEEMKEIEKCWFETLRASNEELLLIVERVNENFEKIKKYEMGKVCD